MGERETRWHEFPQRSTGAARRPCELCDRPVRMGDLFRDGGDRGLAHEYCVMSTAAYKAALAALRKAGRLPSP